VQNGENLEQTRAAAGAESPLGHGIDETALARQPDAGRVFRVDGLGVVGVPYAPYRGQTRQ
jgi:hypothetical protein